MDATAFVYDLSAVKGKKKTYLIRKVFGYSDSSNNGKYSYQREGILTPYTKEKWGKSVIISKRSDSAEVGRILKANKIPYKTKEITL